MERKDLYAYAVLLIATAVLLVVAISEYDTIGSLNGQLSVLQKQQKELSGLLVMEHAADMDAARRAWAAANQQENISLQRQGITVEADSVETGRYTLVLDLRDPAQTRVDATPHVDVAPGEAVVFLGQYYAENMTRVPGWTVSYTVNTTTHAVSGLTSLLMQNIASEYYSRELAPGIDAKLGIAEGSVTGSSARSIDCSSLTSGDWLDVKEYRYSLKNVDFRMYLLIKTYVNATTQAVTAVDVSTPYYESVTGLSY